MIETRIARLALAAGSPQSTASQSLERLGDGVLTSSRNIAAPSAADTWFQASLQKVEHEIAERTAFIGNDDDYVKAVRSFAQIKAFCTAYHLDWLVVGNGS